MRWLVGVHYGLLLLVALSIYTVLLCLVDPLSKSSHVLQWSGGSLASSPPPPPAPPSPVYLHSVFAGQCEYNLTSAIPRITTLTGGKQNPLFVYDSTFQFEYGGGGEGMAYFVGFLEAETPKYMDGGNHGVGAGLTAANELFHSKFQCHWIAAGARDDTPSTSITPAQHLYTQVAWYLHGDTSTFSFYCRIPASIGWVDVSGGQGSRGSCSSESPSPCSLPLTPWISLSLENPLFVGPSHSIRIPVCQRSQTFHTISVCTQPLHAPITPDELKQWMEYHYMLGVDNFYVYDRDGSFATMLKPYEQAGIATRYEFPLLTPGMTAKWYDQPQAMHVCLHRHRYTSRWIFFLDVDEYLHSDTWKQQAPHVQLLLSRYQEAPLHHYTHLIVWKRTAIPQQRDVPWDRKTTLILQHLSTYSQPERVAVKFAIRPWDARTLSIHNPNSFVVFNSREMDLPAHDLVITHMKPYNSLAADQLDKDALPPHPWILDTLQYRMRDPTYQVTANTVGGRARARGPRIGTGIGTGVGRGGKGEEVAPNKGNE